MSLGELARMHGIEPGYTNASGKPQKAAPDTVRKILEALEIPAGNDRQVRDSIRETRLRQAREGLPPVIVSWDGTPVDVTVWVRCERADSPAKCCVTLESGARHELGMRALRQRTRRQKVEGCEFELRRFRLPRLEPGYHRLEYAVGPRVYRSRILSAPTLSYSPPENPRRWGLFMPLYALRSETNWGAGDLADWERQGQWVRERGGSLISTLPLLSAWLGPVLEEPSPYAPISRFFWNEFYLHIPALAEFRDCPAARRLANSPGFQKQLNHFRESDLVDYPAQMAARRRVLELLAERFFEGPQTNRADFERWRQERPDALDYARFRAATERAGISWWRWGERQRNGRLEPGDYEDRAVRYHLYVQWAMHREMVALRGRQKDLSVYLDLPLGVSTDGYDLWRHRGYFLPRVSAGAPPDPFFSSGQSWGFPPLHPERIRRLEYRYVIDYLRFQMAYCDYLRVDHVMGLHRLYWIPPGTDPKSGAYVKYRAEEWHAILSLESHRQRTVIAGENLGTVPQEVNEAMHKHGLRRLYVLPFEQSAKPREGWRRPPQACIASLNTHDLPTFAAQWQGSDLELRKKLGLLRGALVNRERRAREKQNAALAKFLARQGKLADQRANPAEVLKACLEWLAESPAEVLLINLEDLWLETMPQNVPGTHREYPNWRRKISKSAPRIAVQGGRRGTESGEGLAFTARANPDETEAEGCSSPR